MAYLTLLEYGSFEYSNKQDRVRINFKQIFFQTKSHILSKSLNHLVKQTKAQNGLSGLLNVNLSIISCTF